MNELLNYFLLLLIIFSPTFVANSSPILIKNLPYLKNFNKAISEKYFGKNKTYRGFVGGIICSVFFSIVLFVFLKNFSFELVSKYYEIITNMNITILAGFIQGFGALFGDIIESFIKRKIGKKPGEAWFFWDGIDYILGSMLFFSIIFFPNIIGIIFLILFAPIISLIANTISYLYDGKMYGIKKILNKIQEGFLTLLFVGKTNKAPGTMGSILSFLIILFFWFYLNFSILFLILLFIIITIISIPIIDNYEKREKIHDSKHIVIDEFVGVLITYLIIIFFTQDIHVLVFGLILFRVFDILKPGLIGLVDKKVKGGFGVMLDDVLAGIMVGISTLVIFYLIKNLDNILLIEIFLSLFIIFLSYFGIKFSLKNIKIRNFIIIHNFLHPNSISYFRIPLGVLSIILFYYDYEILRVCLFSFAVITDAIDGMIARACNLTSELGKSLDPLADKLVYFVPLVYFGFIGKINFYLIFLFILIDTLGQFSRIILKKLKLETKANNYGKFKTIFVFVLIFYLMIFENKNLFISDIFYNNLLMIFAVLFALLSIIFKFIKK